MTAIIGWAHTKFGKLEDENLEALIARAGREAVEHAGIAFKDVDAIYVGNFGGFEKQSFPAAFALDAHPDLRFRPATRIENACATGPAAIHVGANAVDARAARLVHVNGDEKLTTSTDEAIG